VTTVVTLYIYALYVVVTIVCDALYIASYMHELCALILKLVYDSVVNF